MYCQYTSLLDSTFSDQGIDLLQIGRGSSNSYTAAIQSSGRIILIGKIDQGISVVGINNSDGEIDTTFGEIGFGNCVLNGDGFGYPTVGVIFDGAIQNDDKILVCGYSNNDDDFDDRDFFVVRFKENGIIDSSFSEDGVFILNMTGPGDPSADWAYSISVLPDGKILVGGTSKHGYTSPVIFKLTSAGILDTLFGTEGIIKIEGLDQYVSYADIIVLEDEKIILTGEADSNYPGFIRFLPSGEIDSTFGVNGIKIDSFTITTPFIRSAVSTNGNKFLTASWSSYLMINKYLGDGQKDSSFYTYILDLFPGNEYPTEIICDSTGNIYFSFYASTNSDYYIGKLFSDGTIDSNFGVDGIVT
ncbi:MAG: delta-60 repeat domain-containing protein, partial [Chitinophagales bacterium]